MSQCITFSEFKTIVSFIRVCVFFGLYNISVSHSDVWLCISVQSIWIFGHSICAHTCEDMRCNTCRYCDNCTKSRHHCSVICLFQQAIHRPVSINTLNQKPKSQNWMRHASAKAFNWLNYFICHFPLSLHFEIEMVDTFGLDYLSCWESIWMSWANVISCRQRNYSLNLAIC